MANEAEMYYRFISDLELSEEQLTIASHNCNTKRSRKNNCYKPNSKT
jgi:hypothetical protein